MLEENVVAQEDAGGFVDTSPRPFREVMGLWGKVGRMPEVFFVEEAPRASGLNAFLGVLPSSVVRAVLAFISGQIAEISQSSSDFFGPSYSLPTWWEIAISLVGGTLVVVGVFCFFQALSYVLARVLGGGVVLDHRSISSRCLSFP